VFVVDRVFADPRIEAARLAREVENAAWGPQALLRDGVVQEHSGGPA
jgi:hypothetical protein